VLFRSANVLILDEPTAVLTPQEVEDFFAIVRSLRDAGKAIIFITHKLNEILEVADRISVLRAGGSWAKAIPKTDDPRGTGRDDGRAPRALRRRQDRVHAGRAACSRSETSPCCATMTRSRSMTSA
jgi:energy-coupling factor transporter ATP-binding protein EcfA2